MRRPKKTKQNCLLHYTQGYRLVPIVVRVSYDGCVPALEMRPKAESDSHDLLCIILVDQGNPTSITRIQLQV